MTTWHDNAALTDALAEMAGTMSGSAIAAEIHRRFGVKVSRCSVISRMRRKGLRGQPRFGAGVARPTLHSKAKKKPQPAKKPPPKPKPAPAPKLKPEPSWQTPEAAKLSFGEPCTLVELKWQSCRWPLGDPYTHDFRFCGGERLEGQPYCERHHQVAFRGAVK